MLHRVLPGSTATCGRTVTGSQYAFHVQCPFRILQGNRIVLGSGEMNFDLDKAPYDDGAKVVEGFLSAARPEVLRVSINGFGDVRIEMDHEIKLEIFPTSSSSRPEERWRFLARFGTHYSFPDGLDRPA